MRVSKNQLSNAAKQGIISQDQADALFVYLQNQPDAGPAFTFTNILYYFGGLIAIGAMTLFTNLGWGIFFISMGYAGIGYY